MYQLSKQLAQQSIASLCLGKLRQQDTNELCIRSLSGQARQGPLIRLREGREYSPLAAETSCKPACSCVRDALPCECLDGVILKRPSSAPSTCYRFQGQRIETHICIVMSWLDGINARDVDHGKLLWVYDNGPGHVGIDGRWRSHMAHLESSV
ncbi:hypothetical protein LZ31DRAFT_32096 [Colletotrichum somersetense]|nr:hypothetical protein LZ31DRAFT_32096 [Colletotrichum somersetense]